MKAVKTWWHQYTRQYTAVQPAVPSVGVEMKYQVIEGSATGLSSDGKSITCVKSLQGKFQYWLAENFRPK